MTSKLLRIYTAAKLSRAKELRALQLNPIFHGEVFFHARWLFRVNSLNTQDTPNAAKVFWQEDIEDVTSADQVWVFGPAEDTLRGALVEAGAAIALGIPVIAIGNSPSFGTWIHHPGVLHCANYEEVHMRMRSLKRRNSSADY